jgi:hypothetical protein
MAKTRTIADLRADAEQAHDMEQRLAPRDDDGYLVCPGDAASCGDCAYYDQCAGIHEEDETGEAVRGIPVGREAQTFAEIMAPQKLWSDLADQIRPHAEGAIEHAARSLRASWAIGALICEFAKRDDIEREVNRANAGRRGRPWIPENYVAARLADDFKYSKKWLQTCALGYRRACQSGVLPEGDVQTALGWRQAELSLHEGTIHPERLIDAAADKGDDPQHTPEPEKLVQQTFAFVTKRVNALTAQAVAAGKRLDHQTIKPHLDDLNLAFEPLGLAVVARQAKRSS